MAFTHNSTVAKDEPAWGSVDKTKLPRAAFADKGEDGKKSTWGYPHHFIKGGTKLDDDGIWEDGTMYLHEGGLNAAWNAAQGGHTGQKASAEVIAHLEAHRKALGLGKEQKHSVKIPADALCLSADVEIKSNGDDAKTAPIKMLARTNSPVPYPALDAPIVHDFSAVSHNARIPIDWTHDANVALGYLNKIDVSDTGILCSGALISTRDGDKASEVMAQNKAGIPFQCSIFTTGGEFQFVDDGETALINGQQMSGPLYVSTGYSLRGVALCLYGRDSNTAAAFSNKDTLIEMAVVPYKKDVANQKLVSTEEITMSEKPVKAEAEKAVETETVNNNDTKLAEGAKPVEAKTEGTKSVEVHELKLSDGQRFLKAFGDQGGVWFAQGKTYDEAQTLYTDSLKKEIETLRKDNADLKQRFSQSEVGASPVSFSDSPELSGDEEKVQAKAKELEKKGVSATVAQLAAVMALTQSPKTNG